MKIYSRNEWGARHASSYMNYTANMPKRWGYLHHSVTTNPGANATLAQDIAAVRTLESIGQNRFGWGISYSFVIAPSGRIFQGHRVNGVGTHTAGLNSSTLAICFIGNYESQNPTTKQLEAAAWLLRHGHAQKWTTNNQLAGGHRDVSATACPGRNAYSQISEINRLARSGPVSPIKEEEDLSYNKWPAADKRALVADVSSAILDRVDSVVWNRPNPQTGTVYGAMVRELWQGSAPRVVSQFSGKPSSLAAQANWSHLRAREARDEVIDQNIELAELKKLVVSLSKDVAELRKELKADPKG